MILLDTDVCVEILRGNRKIIEKRQLEDDDTAVSFMTAAELYYGAEKSAYKTANRMLVDEFLLTLRIIQSEPAILKKFGELKADLAERRELLPDADIFIAATTLLKADKLITGNTKHFTRFANLRIESWS